MHIVRCRCFCRAAATEFCFIRCCIIGVVALLINTPTHFSVPVVLKVDWFSRSFSHHMFHFSTNSAVFTKSRRGESEAEFLAGNLGKKRFIFKKASFRS